MPEPRKIRYRAESEYNARVNLEPIKSRFLEAGWRVIDTVWSDVVPGYWEEELKGRIWAHESAGGFLSVVYERDPSLPVLPSLNAAIDREPGSLTDTVEAVRSFAMLVRQTHLPIREGQILMDDLAVRGSYMGEYLMQGFLDEPAVLQAFRAIPARVRLEIERADAATFFAKYAV
jgi:hypothetical protein